MAFVLLTLAAHSGAGTDYSTAMGLDGTDDPVRRVRRHNRCGWKYDAGMGAPSQNWAVYERLTLLLWRGSFSGTRDDRSTRADDRGITWAYWALAMILVPLAFFVLRLPSPTIQRVEDASASRQVNYLLVTLLALFFFLNVGAEVSFGGWIYTYSVRLGIGRRNTGRLSDFVILGHIHCRDGCWAFRLRRESVRAGFCWAICWASSWDC
jgi:hypothetical protein